jgi:hypothetical protein
MNPTEEIAAAATTKMFTDGILAPSNMPAAMDIIQSAIEEARELWDLELVEQFGGYPIE